MGSRVDVMEPIERERGPFWQDCAGGCGKRAETYRTLRGWPIYCGTCADDRGLARLPEPTWEEKRQLLEESRSIRAV